MSGLNKRAINLLDDKNREIKNCNEIIRKSILLLYIHNGNTIEEVKLLDGMIKGYEEMSRINLELCEMGICEDCDQLNNYEVRLSESDFLDDSDSEKRRYILC